jgi:hypothetical protein
LAEKKAEGERKRADKEREMHLAAEGIAEKKMECERKRADRGGGCALGGGTKGRIAREGDEGDEG